MSDLVVVIFEEKHRASKIFYQMQHESGNDFSNLRNAIVYIPCESPGAIIEQSINLNNPESLGWSKFWSSFLAVTMLTPFYYNSTNFVEEFGNYSEYQKFRSSDGELSNRWWKEEIGISLNLIRDLKALLQPNSSAILMIIDNLHESFLESEDFSTSYVYRLPLDEKKFANIHRYFL